MTDTAAPRTDRPAIQLPDGVVSDPEPRFRLADYAALLKPRVMSLVVFTAMVGLVMAPGQIGPVEAFAAILCISLGAGASGAINMWYDRDIDLHMQRTQMRPIPAGRMEAQNALWFGTALATLSVIAMVVLVNEISAALLALTILYYVFIYTVWLKRRTPQNIVIGGASGALPPVIGWAAVTGNAGFFSDPWGAVALFMIIFLWTPPHTWALALFRRQDYQNVGVPMLPVVAGDHGTKLQMAIYTALLIPATFAPVAIGVSGWLYLAVAALLNVNLCRHMMIVWRTTEGLGMREGPARPMFFYTIFYLFGIFVALLADRTLFFAII
ncbi:MAG: heme o synthase [Rhodospirillaceae bacterium]